MNELSTSSAAALAPDVKDIGGTPDAEVLDRDVRTTPQEMTLAKFVYKTFLDNEQYAVRQGFHDQMRESWRVCRSEYTPAEKAKLQRLGIPEDVSDPVVELRKFIALSQLKEIFSTSGNFPAKLTSTSRPEVPKYVTEALLKQMLDELVQVIQATGVIPDEGQAAEFGRNRMAELMNAEKEHAHDEIEILERRVRDDFEEANFIEPFNLGMEYLTVYGTALWEGPVPCVRWKNDWDKGGKAKIKRKASNGVAFRAINPLDVYPSLDQTEVEDGSICIKVRFAPQELWLNATEAGGDEAETGMWFRDTVKDLLDKYPTGGVRLSWQDGDEKNREMRGQSTWIAGGSCMMEGISFYGQVKGNLLIRMGIIKTHDGMAVSSDDYYEVNAIVIDDYCVYCRIINPCLGRPLFKAQFYDATDAFFGESLAQRLIGYQRVMNGSLQSLIVNMNMTGAPIVWISAAEQLLDKSPNRFKLEGGKVFAFKRNVAGVNMSTGAPMGVLRAESRVHEILAVMNMAIRRIDDVSGIPSYTYGQNVTGGAGRTLGGLAMLTEAANRGMKMIVDTIARKVINPMVRMDAYRLMLYDDSIKYAGDVEVLPIGVMGLILKQQEMQKVLQLMQIVASNQFLVQTIGPRGLMELFRQVLETYEIVNIDKIIPPKGDLDLQEYVTRLQNAAKAQTMVNQAQQPQIEGQQGQPAAPRTMNEEYSDGSQPSQEMIGMEGEPSMLAMAGNADERRGAG
jgi:hypothetical protein